MEREYEVGQHVIFVDPKGRRREALITAWWQAWISQPPDYKETILDPNAGEPGCNLIVVSEDEKKDDTFGRQSEHETSVVHKSAQNAPGNFWCWPDE